MTDRWTMLEEAPTTLADVAELYSWSLNYDPGKGPFTLFLDLIGYTQDEYGETLYDLRDPSLGYVELDKLARALMQYTTDPRGVTAWCAEIIEAEMQDA